MFLGDLAERITNGYVGESISHQVTDPRDGILYVQGTNVRKNCFDWSNTTYVTNDFHKKQTKSALRTGDILTVQSGHIGTTAVVDESLGPANCHALIITRLKDGVANPRFISYYLNSAVGQARMKGLHVGSTIAHINTSELAKYKIPLPPLWEQTALVNLFSILDRRDALVSRLLIQQRNRRTVLTQQLMTRRRRFPGFTRPWNRVRIDRILSESRILGSGGKSAKKLSVKLYGKGVIAKDGRIEGSDQTQYYVRKSGQFIYSKLDFLNGAFGIIPRHLDAHESTLDLPCFDFSGMADPEFFLSFVSRSSFYRRHLGLANGGRKARRVNPSDLLKCEVELPEPAEQSSIVQFLKSLNLEISMTEGLLAAFQLEKRTLVQHLLAGKRRVHASVTSIAP